MLDDVIMAPADVTHHSDDDTMLFCPFLIIVSSLNPNSLVNSIKIHVSQIVLVVLEKLSSYTCFKKI